MTDPQITKNRDTGTAIEPPSEAGDRSPSILCHRLSYSYPDSNRVLSNVDLEIGSGQVVILTGPSGSGKSTLLALIGGRLKMQSGYLRVIGHEMNSLISSQLLEVRRQIGFIFQGSELIESLTAAENIAVSLRYQRLSRQQRRQRIEEVLSQLGLQERASYRPGRLSGGQRQRLSIARALAHSPQLILADEPTSALYEESARRLMEIIQRQARERGCTSLIVTHDNRCLAFADSVLCLTDGRIVTQERLGTSAVAPQPPAPGPPAVRSEVVRSSPTTLRPPRIFICYRREDTADITDRIHDHLIPHFGKENIFLDIDTIPIGVDFREHIDQAVSQCNVLLAVVGEQWLEIRHLKGTKQGQRRLDDEADFVRLEIRSALARGIPVIPVLVGWAEMPREDDLPNGLRDLAYRNATEVRSGRDFHHHVQRLIRDIQRLMSSQEQAKPIEPPQTAG